MLPFEFIVPGPPVSHQSRNRGKLTAWKQTVRQVAADRWVGTGPVGHSVRMVVTYYHAGAAVRIDDDNLLKPIQDALNQLVYRDDSQVTDVAVRKTGIDGEFRVRGASMVLLEGFSRGSEFLHVLIEDAPAHSQLLR